MERQGDTSSEPQGFINFNELNKTLRDLDERALVLTLAAFAEDTLGDLLSAFMIPSAASRSLVTGFNAPLGNFSSRIKAAFALGLISKGQFDDLQHLREVRNKFSHTWKPISFADPSVEGHIKAVRYGRMTRDFPKTLQRKLLVAFQNLLIELQVAVKSIEDGKQAKFVGAHLTSGFSGDTFDKKMERASEELAHARAKHSSAEGEEKLFYDMVLWELRYRIERFLKDVPPESTPKLSALVEDLNQLLAGRPDPSGNML
ncbi:MltR family transcriptional regulator [Pseudomonas moorei]|uniref:MltR family transcriptional regulator n=1 Tax=Pseudomonas moorei TaxID=395599 RepID=UPI0036F2F5EF